MIVSSLRVRSRRVPLIETVGDASGIFSVKVVITPGQRPLCLHCRLARADRACCHRYSADRLLCFFPVWVADALTCDQPTKRKATVYAQCIQFLAPVCPDVEPCILRGADPADGPNTVFQMLRKPILN